MKAHGNDQFAVIAFQHSKAYASRFSSGAAKVPSTTICAQFIAGSPLSISVQDFRHGQAFKFHLHRIQRRAFSRASRNALSASFSSPPGHLVRTNMGHGSIVVGSVTSSRLILPNHSSKRTREKPRAA